MRTLIIILAFALFPGFAEAQLNIFNRKKAAATPTNLPESVTNNSPSANLQNGDVIQMRLSGPPEEYTREFAVELTVDDGTINVPMIGRVRATGITPAQLGTAVEKQLIEQKIFTLANVNINTQQTPRFIIVGGAVRSPGRQQWTQGLTLSAAISASAGPAEYAEDGVRLTRGGQIYRYSRRAIKENSKLDPKILPSDVIEVDGEF